MAKQYLSILYLSCITRIFFIVVFIASLCNSYAQLTETNRSPKPPYDRKEEIIVSAKRYRVHNNYLTLGGGFLSSSIRDKGQKNIGIDFQFHIRRQHFQGGVVMSGNEFRSNNNVQAHLGYGYRIEKRSANFAAFGGITYYSGVVATKDSIPIPILYDGFGAYVCVQAISKLAYDFGIGAEAFAEINHQQSIVGFRLIAYFSGAYRGPARNYNPNVRPKK